MNSGWYQVDPHCWYVNPFTETAWHDAGSELTTDHALLHIDLMETVDELPVRIRTMYCTLEELGCNCKLIAKGIFRLLNLKEW